MFTQFINGITVENVYTCLIIFELQIYLSHEVVLLSYPIYPRMFGLLLRSENCPHYTFTLSLTISARKSKVIRKMRIFLQN